MDRSGRSAFARLATLLGLCLLIVPARAAFEYPYCSSQNTAGDYQAMTDTWQSNGLCTDHCKTAGSYAFAVINYKDCWCSNYIPTDQRDSSDCTTTCPGFKTENCGDRGENLYIYVKLNNEPSGTVGGSTPTSSDNTKRPASTTQSTLQTTTSEDPDPAPAPPQTSERVITQSGAVITETVITTPTSAPLQHTPKSSSNTGAIVGGVVGGVAGVLALVGGVFFALWRRRRQQRPGNEGQSGVQRNTSTMSRSGLLGTEKEPQRPPPLVTNFNRRPSRNMDQDSISPISGSDRRNSRHLVDQRLNPSTLFVFDNSSNFSVGSVDDSRDYHRPLNVRNPDPES